MKFKFVIDIIKCLRRRKQPFLTIGQPRKVLLCLDCCRKNECIEKRDKLHVAYPNCYYALNIGVAD
ncbi:MAG: hypothetical protein N2645_18390 [Clostridia bacterium]|nr:hypothetical protein [Clostridia bacterium]